MCGICGYISSNQLNHDTFIKMNNTMEKRGPDDSGTFRSKMKNGRYIGLAQRRLSIQDLSSLGHQPMFSFDNSVAIIFNGEIYNFRELRRMLEKKGYPFRSNCDTEVILNLYLEYGNEFLAMLNGMFAIALYDIEKDLLLLARDRIGEKPLYYYTDHSSFIFASELKPLMAYPGYPKIINTDLFSRYLANNYLPSPETVFCNTFKVMPGEMIIWREGNLFKEKYWDLLPIYYANRENKIEDYKEAYGKLKDLMFDAVDKRLISDVPAGIFLSGGIDSVLTAAVAKELTGKKIRTYTIGFHDAKQDEAVYAKEIAKYIGTEHSELYVSDSDLLNLVESLPDFFDEPLSDSSEIPQIMVAKLAKKDITVALSGTGADELFCGYKMYDWLYKIQRLNPVLNIGEFLLKAPVLNKLAKSNFANERVMAILNNRNTDLKTQLFIEPKELHIAKMLNGSSFSAKFDLEKYIVEDNWQAKRMILDLATYVPDEILAVADRSSMSQSLEVRCPILDYRIIELAFQMPHSFKYHNKEKKYILKDLTYHMVPQRLLDRPKHGFTPPIGPWLRGPLNKKLKTMSEKDKLMKQGFFNYDYIHYMIHKLETTTDSIYVNLLWSYLVFQMWYDKYIEAF